MKEQIISNTNLNISIIDNIDNEKIKPSISNENLHIEEIYKKNLLNVINDFTKIIDITKK